MAVWRRPVVALYAFIVGLALHNAAMDALYAAGIRGHSLTAIQAWKDVLLLVALARVAFDAARARRLPFKPALPDALALAFAAIVVLYALDPAERARRTRDAQGGGIRAAPRPRPASAPTSSAAPSSRACATCAG